MKKKINNSAQMHVLDAITAITIIVVAIIFTTYIGSIPSVSNPHTSSQLKILADDALRNLDSQNANWYGKDDMTLLEYYLSEHINGNDIEGFSQNLSKGFPPFMLVSYNVWLYNSSTDKTFLWYPSEAETPFGTVVRAHRIVALNESQVTIYDVIVEVWSK